MGSEAVDTTRASKRDGTLRGWFKLALGVGLIWTAMYVVLPWGKTLPYIKPIMTAIDASDIDATAYWYTQSEETAIAQMYVRNTIRHQ